MNENDFKISFGKLLEREFKVKVQEAGNTLGMDFIDLYNSIPDCKLYFEYTGIFSRREWDTYRAVLHLQVDFNKYDLFEKYEDVLLDTAAMLFGKQNDYYLTDISIEPRVGEFETFDFSELGLNETLRRAVSEATHFMEQGKYSSCIDRVHTALHGYIRAKLNELEIPFEESDMLPKLFNLLYRQWESLDNNEMDDMILKALRSASSLFDIINIARNRYSLAHPNENIIGEEEARLILGLVCNIINYMENRKFRTERNY